MLGTIRAGVRSARSSTLPGRASRPSASASTSASTQPLRLGVLPTHPRSVVGNSRRSAARGWSSRVNGGARQQPIRVRTRGPTIARVSGDRRQGMTTMTTAGGGGGDGGVHGKDSEEGSYSSDSDSDGSDDENGDAPKQRQTEGSGASRFRTPTKKTGDGVRKGPSRSGIGRGHRGVNSFGTDTSAAGRQDKSSGSSGSPQDTGVEGDGDGAGDAEEDGSRREYDYRSVGSEIFEGGDLEAGEAIQGMYDFVDDIVETQHVPTIQDPFDHKGRFHRCPGKRQGKAALPSTCQIFDLKELHINHTPLLKRFVNDAGMILGRHRTGLCSKCQRKVAGTIKAARQMGFIPTVSDYEVRDTGPGGLFAWAGKDGDHEAMAKAKAAAEIARLKKEEKRFGSLV